MYHAQGPRCLGALLQDVIVVVCFVHFKHELRNLATDQNFAQINIKISHAMSRNPGASPRLLSHMYQSTKVSCWAPPSRPVKPNLGRRMCEKKTIPPGCCVLCVGSAGVLQGTPPWLMHGSACGESNCVSSTLPRRWPHVQAHRSTLAQAVGVT